MTLEENIKEILEYHFDIAKEEIIEAATKRIMEQISRQSDNQYATSYQNGYHEGLHDAIEAIKDIAESEDADDNLQM